MHDSNSLWAKPSNRFQYINNQLKSRCLPSLNELLLSSVPKSQHCCSNQAEMPKPSPPRCHPETLVTASMAEAVAWGSLFWAYNFIKCLWPLVEAQSGPQPRSEQCARLQSRGRPHTHDLTHSAPQSIAHCIPQAARDQCWSDHVGPAPAAGHCDSSAGASHCCIGGCQQCLRSGKPMSTGLHALQCES